MSRYRTEPAYTHGSPARIGVLLVNLGTPAAPTAQAVRPYLKQFLSDPRVVEIPRLVWWPILNGIILNVRPKKSAHAYEQVWGPDGSPLAAITKAQAAALQARLGDGVMVRWAMRYGNPALGAEVQAMKDAGCERILVAPLYPQYSGATTATVIDALGQQLAKMRWQPAIRTLPPYYDDAVHVEALRADVRKNLEREVKFRLQARNKTAVMDALIAQAELDLPKASVESEVQRLVEGARADLKQRGIKDADKAPIPAELFKDQAERRVRLGLVVAELVNTNDLAAKPEQIDAHISELASSYERPEDVVRWYKTDNRRLAEVEAIVIENNVTDFVLGKAKVTDKTISFEELMGQG